MWWLRAPRFYTKKQVRLWVDQLLKTASWVWGNDDPEFERVLAAVMRVEKREMRRLNGGKARKAKYKR